MKYPRFDMLVRLLSLPLILLGVSIFISPEASLAQAIAAGSTKTNSRNAASSELQLRLDAQAAATKSLDSATVAETSRKLSALGLLEMARIKAKSHAWSPAVELYRQSLALEDRPDTRTELSLALNVLQHSNGSHSPSTEPSSSRQPASTTVQHLSLREKQLAHILGSSFNDWGTAEARQQQDERALIHFQEAERWDPTIPQLMRNLGMVAFRSGNFPESVRAFSRIVQTDPSDSNSLLFLAMSLFSMDRFADAAKAFAPISDSALKDPRSAYAMVYSLARSNQQARANELLDQLTSGDPPPEVLNLLCQIYNTTENYEHSVTCFRRVYEIAPGTPRAHYQVAVALIRLDRPTEAIPELRKEEVTSPNDPDVEYQLAYALLQTSGKTEAESLLRKVVLQRPEDAPAQYELGKLLLEAGNIPEAIQHLEIAAANDASKDYIHYQLQLAYRRANRLSEADHELALYREIKAKHREAAPTSAH